MSTTKPGDLIAYGPFFDFYIVLEMDPKIIMFSIFRNEIIDNFSGVLDYILICRPNLEG